MGRGRGSSAFRIRNVAGDGKGTKDDRKMQALLIQGVLTSNSKQVQKYLKKSIYRIS